MEYRIRGESISVEALKKVIEEDNGKLKYYDALHCFTTAASVGSLPSLKFLVELKGAKYFVSPKKDKDFNSKVTALHYAFMSGSMDCIKYLLSIGFEPDIEEVNDRPLIDWALRAKNLSMEILHFLESLGCNFHLHDEDYSNAFYKAVSENQPLEILQYLVSKGANVHSVYQFMQFNAFSTAIICDYPVDKLKYIASLGVNIFINDTENANVFLLAVRSTRSIEVLQWLLSLNLDPLCIDNRNWNALNYYLDNYHPFQKEIFEYLVSLGLDINYCVKGKNLLDFALTQSRDKRAIRYLLNLPLKKNPSKRTIVKQIINYADIKLLKFFDNEIDQEIFGLVLQNMTKDHFSWRMRNTIKTLDYLLSKKTIDINRKINNYYPIQLIITEHRYARELRILLDYFIDKGCDLMKESDSGSVLHSLMMGDRAEINPRFNDDLPHYHDFAKYIIIRSREFCKGFDTSIFVSQRSAWINNFCEILDCVPPILASTGRDIYKFTLDDPKGPLGLEVLDDGWDLFW